jgi:hypothetical protein
MFKSGLLLAVCAFVAASSAVIIRSAAAEGTKQSFKVTSTLDGKKVLPHRIHWFAFPNMSASRVAEVDFLIDGKLSWIEHHAPYAYGYNANYLVTSWLAPGAHHFTVRAIATDGSRATDSTVARVLPTPPPPSQLADTRWKRTLTAAQAHGQPHGTWVLSINRVGWKIKVPPIGANLIDVGYLSPGLLELRGGIWTKPPPANNPEEGNGWCDEPFQPVRYRWSVQGGALTLTLAGPKRCDGQSVILAGEWSRD